MIYREAQFLISQMHAMRAHAEIVSGAYKQAQVFKLLPEGGECPFTDEEKLQRKVEEMNRHINLMHQAAEGFPTSKTEIPTEIA